MSITIDVSEAIAKIDPVKMERAVEAAIDGAANLVRDDIKPYPPAPAGSSYIRTMTLYHSWSVRTQRLRAIIGNNTPYAHWVQGIDQAWMHKGRWRTVADVAQKMAEPVKRHIEQALARWAS